jgi:hypothetical protein
VHGVLVDLLDDAEGYVPLEVDYLPESAGQPMEYRIIERYGELASHVRGVALARGRVLAARLKLIYIAHHL